MPIFEYKCNKCGHVMEFLEKTSTPKKHKCRKCNSSDLKKLLSGFAVGQSSSTTPTCESCPGGLCQTDGCSTGACPYSS
ncbi:MAG: zinc ribbon domain-containing protein [Sedimentisphaerales bacterium]|nr:zinc ribbon domain-containing protein [Sedimentisphaerales bacterium]